MFSCVLFSTLFSGELCHFALIFLSASFFATQNGEARNIYFPINRAVFFANDHNFIDSSVLNALQGRLPPSHEQHQNPHFVERQTPTLTEIADLSNMIYERPIASSTNNNNNINQLSEQQQRQQQQQQQQYEQKEQLLRSAEPSIRDIIGELEEGGGEAFITDGNANDTTVAGCFCCRAFVCQKQRKCPCSKFIF